MLFILVLGGCSNSKTQEKYTIGFSQFSSSENWKEAVVQSMHIETGFHNNIILNISDSKADVDKQISDIENFIEDNVDVIIVSPIAPKPLKPIIKKAVKNKIPVIILDREISIYDSFIGVNNYEVGVNAAKYLQSLKKKLKVVEIKGWAGTTPTKHISLGFRKIIKESESIELVGSIQDSYDGSGILENLEELLNKSEQIDYVFAHSDDLALKAYEVFKSSKHKHVKFIGVGGLNSENEGLDLVKKEIFEATVLCPTGGKEAIQAAVSFIKGEEVNSEILLPSVVVDATNVDLLSRQLALIQAHEFDIEKQQQRIDDQVKLYNSQRDFLIATLIFLGIIIILLIITLRAKRKLIKQKRLLVKLIDQIDSQKKEIEKIAEDLRVTHETTNNFFMGVSHDFKTPISLILSSTESLIGSETQQKSNEFNLIYNNSRRLLRMINQLLDFRRVESRSFKLKASKTNIESFVTSIFSDFNSEANKKQIDFSLKSKIKDSDVFIDRDLFDNILFNLLSNAFKFTPIGGKIIVSIEETLNKVFISIKDTGIGIPSSENEKIFNQFYQGTNNQKTSSGIGLFLTKEYVKLHNGDIRVISEKNKGAEFIISIPKGKTHLKEEEIINANIKEISIPQKQLIERKSFEFKKSKKEKERLLVIEDNNDLREFLKNKLSEFYEVHDSDGINVKDKILETIPDVIISDVNLPEISGFEICEMIKKDERTSHIPVLILTALKTDEAHLIGLKSGVDMFLTKPFNLSVLFQSVETLLYNRKKLQKYFKETTKNLKEEKLKEHKKKIKDKESDFINKIDELIDSNIDDSSFTVEVLAEELNISRVQLYRKIKALLGITISDYIQNIRLEKGKEMLLTDETLSIADIAYSVGFSSPNYFSTAFKAKYGDTPKKYKKGKTG
ncbi:substrate-binding domain-containing protein [uncultured Tenacibaculum sp.]|uniref:hybrid sensor histidine kinase/response regulator transcription factor n=1 Tax=uncultured Tenacibaculum sp. TaxID=174713 RepID=UPI0026124253|nr:substrate-binding domain-containing protein [uncultured Tenacibaculum sp.]